MPTGGIEPADMRGYFAAGAVCIGIGGKLVSDSALTAGDDDAIRGTARDVRAALSE